MYAKNYQTGLCLSKLQLAKVSTFLRQSIHIKFSYKEDMVYLIFLTNFKIRGPMAFPVPGSKQGQSTETKCTVQWTFIWNFSSTEQQALLVIQLQLATIINVTKCQSLTKPVTSKPLLCSVQQQQQTCFTALDPGQPERVDTRNVHNSYPSLVTPLITVAPIPLDLCLPSAKIHFITRF